MFDAGQWFYGPCTPNCLSTIACSCFSGVSRTIGTFQPLSDPVPLIEFVKSFGGGSIRESVASLVVELGELMISPTEYSLFF